MDDGEENGKQVRFSPKWVKQHRKKLGMSRRVYAQLLDVSPQTIMGWESGRTRPRRDALRQWRDMRVKGVRELRSILNGADGEGTSRGRTRRRKRRVARGATRRTTRRTTRRVVGRRKRAASARPRAKARVRRTRRARARRR